MDGSSNSQLDRPGVMAGQDSSSGNNMQSVASDEFRLCPAAFSSPVDFAKAVSSNPHFASFAQHQDGTRQEAQVTQVPIDEKPGLGSGPHKDFDVERAQARSHPRLSDAANSVTTSMQALPTVVPQSQQQQQGQQQKSIAAYRPPGLRQSQHVRPGVHGNQVGQPHRTLAARAARFSDSGQPAHQKLSTASATGTAAPADSEQDGLRSAPIVGTCEDMCPLEERESRQRTQNIRLFERPDPRDSGRTSAQLAVKSFARTGIDEAGPAAFRTRGALARTMDHLRGLMDRTDASFSVIHNFLFDRYRSVRQDLYVQGIEDQFACEIYEEIIRYHILCEHELCENEATVRDPEGFSSHLNVEQLNKSLISLLDMYKSAARRGEPRASAVESEFRAYHLLTLMSQHGKFSESRLQFYTSLQAMRLEVQSSAAVQMVLKLRTMLASGNWVAFFKVVQRAPYLLACAAHSYFRGVRVGAMTTMCNVYSRGEQTMQLDQIARTLMLDDEAEAASLCKSFSLTLLKQGGQSFVVFNKMIDADGKSHPNRRSAIISASMRQPPSVNIRTSPVVCPTSTTMAARPVALQSAVQAELPHREFRGPPATNAKLGSVIFPYGRLGVPTPSQQMQIPPKPMQDKSQKPSSDVQQVETAFQDPAEHSHDLSAQKLLQQGRQTTPSDLAKLSQDMHTGSELEQSKEQNDEQQAAVTRQQLEQKRLWQWQEHQRLRWQRQREQHQDELLLQEKARAAGLNQRAAQEQERRRQAERQALRAVELARMRTILRLRLVARLWARAARASAAKRAALRFGAMRLGAPLVAQIKLELQRQAPASASAQLVPPGLGHSPKGAARPSDNQKEHKSSVQMQLPWPVPKGRSAFIAMHLAPTLAVRNPSAVELYCKLLLLIDHAPLADDDRLQCAGAWLCNQMAGPVPTVDTLSGELISAVAAAVTVSGTAARTMRLCVRNISTVTPHNTPFASIASESNLDQAVAGAAGVVVLTNSLNAGSLSPKTVARIAAINPPAPVPLLVLGLLRTVEETEAMTTSVVDVSAAPASSQSGLRQFSAIRLATMRWDASSSARSAAKDALLDGLTWLAENSLYQPRLQAESLESMTVRKTEEALGALHGAWGVTLPTMLAAFNKALADVSAAVSDAAQSAAATWQWPPPELASPKRLPLAVAAVQRKDNGAANLQELNTSSESAKFAEPAALPGNWHQPAVVSAAVAALQSLAAAAPLDEGTSPTEYLQGLASRQLSVHYRKYASTEAFVSELQCNGNWRQHLAAMLRTSLSVLTELPLACVVRLQADDQSRFVAALPSAGVPVWPADWQPVTGARRRAGGTGTRHIGARGLGTSTVGAKRKASVNATTASPALLTCTSIAEVGNSDAAKQRSISTTLDAIECQLFNDQTHSAGFNARLLNSLSGDAFWIFLAPELLLFQHVHPSS
mmetsp:Transcript_6943/g.20274  ORF Transcript_6943/g.20274 Transcript_6943/m.20274 type:complete len:1432 (-) Transcript_6943:843-5138(-)